MSLGARSANSFTNQVVLLYVFAIAELYEFAHLLGRD